MKTEGDDKPRTTETASRRRSPRQRTADKPTSGRGERQAHVDGKGKDKPMMMEKG